MTETGQHHGIPDKPERTWQARTQTMLAAPLPDAGQLARCTGTIARRTMRRRASGYNSTRAHHSGVDGQRWCQCHEMYRLIRPPVSPLVPLLYISPANEAPQLSS
jgi:hypothetical protein